jgi:hypothetical protein
MLAGCQSFFRFQDSYSTKGAVGNLEDNLWSVLEPFKITSDARSIFVERTTIIVLWINFNTSDSAVAREKRQAFQSPLLFVAWTHKPGGGRAARSLSWQDAFLRMAPIVAARSESIPYEPGVRFVNSAVSLELSRVRARDGKWPRGIVGWIAKLSFAALAFLSWWVAFDIALSSVPGSHPHPLPRLLIGIAIVLYILQL